MQATCAHNLKLWEALALVHVYDTCACSTGHLGNRALKGQSGLLNGKADFCLVRPRGLSCVAVADSAWVVAGSYLRVLPKCFSSFK